MTAPSETIGEAAPDRSLYRITGQDRVAFLQGLVTNDVRRLSAGLVYAALLTPQGKYLADFFLVPDGEAILLDADAGQAAALVRRLGMYRLRADVAIAAAEGLHVTRGLGPAPEGAFADPRHPALGWRRYGPETGGAPGIDWDALRVAHLIPAAGIELLPDDTYILETGFERLNGVDFRKGCYVGQEVTARMKHKTELRKGIARVALDAPVAAGTPILAGEREVGTVLTGTVLTGAGHAAIAYLRFALVQPTMNAAGIGVRIASED